jgi:hypothetical protein
MEQDFLCSEIDAFLQDCCSTGSPPQQGFAYWNSRPSITRAEIEVLDSLGEGPQDAAALACRLERDLQTTLDFLEALVAIGILKRRGDRYTTSTATRLYCQAVLHGPSAQDELCSQE